MIDDLLRSLMSNLTAQGGSAPLAYALFSGKPPTPKQDALAQSYLPADQGALSAAPWGDPSVPAMSPYPLEGTLRTGGAFGQAGLPADGAQGYTADVLQHLKDVISGKVAYEGALGPGYQGDNRALDIATGFGPGAIRLFHGAARPFEPAPGAPLGRFDPNRIGSGEGLHRGGARRLWQRKPKGRRMVSAHLRRISTGYRGCGKGQAGRAISAGSGIDSTSGLRHRFTGEESNYAEYLDKIGLDPKRPSEWVRAAEREADFEPGVKGGALYEMEHPTADPEHFLRWRAAGQPAIGLCQAAPATLAASRTRRPGWRVSIGRSRQVDR